VRFVDIKDDYNIDESRIKEKINEKTKVIMPVHLYGNSCDMDGIMKIAKENDLKVVEDCCQAHGAEYKGKKLPIGDVGCFSFYPSKNMTTGEGGMIVTDDDEINEKVRLLRDHGSKERYKHEVLGYNYRMMDMNAVIGIKQLEKLDVFNEKRRKNAEFYDKNLKNVKKPITEKEKKHVYHQYTVRVKNREEVIKKLEENGIGYGIYYDKPIYKQESYNEDLNLENTEKICKEVLSLPVHPGLKEEDLKKIVEVLK
ncbi:aminotransferase DegT, partial [archaeon]|nr:aminotransferase DegT [archaeon]